MGSSKLRGRRDEKSTKEPPEGHSLQHVPRDGAYTVLIKPEVLNVPLQTLFTFANIAYFAVLDRVRHPFLPPN